MPVFKDLEDLVKQLIERQEEEFRRIEREIRREFEELENFARVRAPLYTIEEYSDCYKILIDIPKADTSTLKVVSMNDEIKVYCTTKSGETYYLKFKLPSDADPKSVEVNRQKWLIVITVKKQH